MKKYISLIALLLCLVQQVWADQIQVSATLPSEGTPEHLYTMQSGYGYYANGTTSPTQTAANRALFAFYQSEAEGAYYIYCYTSNKWLGYTKSPSYDNGGCFLVLSDTKTEGAYFKCNNYSGDNYDIAPYNTTGVASKYLNWYLGVSDSANPPDGTVPLGLWEQNGATDAGSRWVFSEVFLPISHSTTLPSEGKPEHLYTMKNGNGLYANGATSPTRTEANRALFAFYGSGVAGAYYIYCYSSQKWLGYDNTNSDTNMRNFIQLSERKADAAYFKFTYNAGNGSFDIVPYNATGVASKYLNWNGGTDYNPLDGTNTLGLWQQNGAADTGSRWIFEEVALSNQITVGGIIYNLNHTAHTAAVAENSGITGSVSISETVKQYGISYTVTAIGEGAFYNCTGLTSITIPNSVTSLGEQCFRDCTGLTSITIPNSVTSLGNSCFSGCRGLTSITIPNSVTSLDYECFDGCTGLTSITIPNSVTSLGFCCFYRCTGLTNIKMKSSTPPSTASSALSACSSLTTVYVPKGAESAYNVKPWNNYEIVEFLDALNLSDNGSAIYAQAEDAAKDEITYTRNYAHTGWQALYVPFDIPYDEISDNFDVAELNDVHQFDDDGDGAFDRTELEVLRLKAGDVIAHNTPYVIRAKAAGEHTITVTDATLYKSETASLDCSSLKYRYVFQGTYSGVGGSDMYSNGYYSFSEGTLRKAASASAALGGFRWYVSVEALSGTPVSPAALPAKMRIVENEGGEATGIAAAPTTAPLLKDAPVYDLNGRRVGTADAMDALPKGIYIVNGKKVIR